MSNKYEKATEALRDAAFGLDRAAELQRDPTLRRDFEELAQRARAALSDLDSGGED